MEAMHDQVETPSEIWIISKGKYINGNLNLNTGQGGFEAGPLREYIISDLAKYLLSPKPIEIKKKLLGCKVFYHPLWSHRLRERIKKIIPQRFQRFIKEKELPSETFLAQSDTKIPFLKNRDFQTYCEALYSYLIPYDPVVKKLTKLEGRKINNILGICEEIGTNRTWLTIQGSSEDKKKYVCQNVLRDVGVILKRAYISEGLFEMNGFDFSTYDPRHSARLIRFYQGGKHQACVLDAHNRVEFWIDDLKILNYMHLFEQSVKTNFQLYQALNLCRQEKARALKLLFTNRIEVDYSKERLPSIYREVFENCQIGVQERGTVINSLKTHQLGISLHYLPQSDSGEEKMVTNLSIMHDVKALEPLKEELPHLYLEISKRATISEAGRFYLLDSIEGYKNGH